MVQFTKRLLWLALLVSLPSVLAASDSSVISASTTSERSKASSTAATPTHSITGHIIFQSASPEPTSFVSTDSAIESTNQATVSADKQTSEESEEPSSTEVSGKSASALSHIQDELKAECSAAGVEDWDRTLQIAAVFIILVIGGIGAMIPVACRHIRWFNISPKVLSTGKFFGAGVILATAFVHMLGGATETLKDECLDGRMGEFDAWPGFLAMLAILAMHLMEHVLSTRLDAAHESKLANAGLSVGGTVAASPGDDTPMFEDKEKQEHSGHVHAPVFLDMDQRRKQLSTYILELGIALHSVIVGMTLAVTGGTEFKTLLAAISFHQFFEGMALGTRIAALNFSQRPFLMGSLNALVFALTTPLGQVVGIAIRESFAPRSPSTLLTMGVLDGLSAGILMYSAIVNLLVEEFSSAEFKKHSRRLRILYFGAMYAGCAAMSVIGRWA
ncbi:hypothetical protein GGI07_003261 [Coemansia sp. Benny D115]|nr:hypothetical protein GGI07_003261 [Coemansia sp. Benny D115]